MNCSFATMLHSSSIYEHILSEMPEETLQSCFVGNYLDPDEDVVEVSNSYSFCFINFILIIY